VTGDGEEGGRGGPRLRSGQARRAARRQPVTHRHGAYGVRRPDAALASRGLPATAPGDGGGGPSALPATAPGDGGGGPSARGWNHRWTRMNTDGINHRGTEDTEKREEGSGRTAKVAKTAKDAERTASHESTRIGTNAGPSHESTRIGTNAGHTPDAWNREPGTLNPEPRARNHR